MTRRQTVLLGLVIASVIYTPIGIYVFDNSLATMLERAYFMMAGGTVALYA